MASDRALLLLLLINALSVLLLLLRCGQVGRHEWAMGVTTYRQTKMGFNREGREVKRRVQQKNRGGDIEIDLVNSSCSEPRPAYYRPAEAGLAEK